MQEHNRKNIEQVKPDYRRFEGLELNAQQTWWSVLTKFRGPELSIVSIMIITITVQESWFMALSICLITVLGLPYWGLKNATTIEKNAQGSHEPGRTGGGETET